MGSARQMPEMLRLTSTEREVRDALSGPRAADRRLG